MRIKIESIVASLCMFCVVSAAHAQSPGPYKFPLPARTMKRLKVAIIKDDLELRGHKSECRNKTSSKKKTYCDLDKDRLSNLREKRLKTNPAKKDTDGDFLADRAELLKFNTDPRIADSDADGVPDGDEDSDGDGISNEDEDDKPGEAPGPEDLDDNTSNQCLPPNFDADGNTTQFSIPSGLIGNQARGQAVYSRACSLCHSGIEKGTNFTFPRLKLRISQAPMFITSISDSDLADLVSRLNRTQLGGTGTCTGLPTPTPEPMPTTPTNPTATPTPLPTIPSSGCSNQYFDQNGNTSQFGIPAPLVGNINAGISYYNLACTSCHGEKGTNFTYAQLKTAVNGPLMNINLPDQTFANLTAFLNRSSAPQNCGTPAPTPTPLDNISAGRIIFESTCQSCHSRPREFRNLSLSELNSKLRDVREMRGIQLTADQKTKLLAYLHSL